MFDPLIVFLKQFCEKLNLNKVSRGQKDEKLPSMQSVRMFIIPIVCPQDEGLVC